MNTQPIRICYQSYVDYENGKTYWDTLRAYLAKITYPGTTIDIWGITPFDSYAHNLVEMRCAREMICNAIAAEREGYDAFIVGHFQDAGLYEARAVVDIPVVSLGESSMLYSCQLAQRIGIVTINTRFIPWFHHQIRKYGLTERVTGVHAMKFEPGQLLGAMGDVRKTLEAKTLFCDLAEPLVEDGVELILAGGGIPMLLFADQFGFNVSGAPVVNGIDIVVKAAETAVFLQRISGLGVSRAGDYVKPPPHIIEEFLGNPKGL